MVYGDLLSTWPITGGVLADHGMIYSIAGLLDTDNTYVVALNAKTGAVKWRNDTSGHLNPQNNTGVAGMGYPAIARGRLWIRSASYDLATGECHPTFNPKDTNVTSSKGTLHRYTGYMGDAFLVTGGRRFYDEQHVYIGDSEHPNNVTTAYFIELNDDASGKLPVAVPWGSCRVMPAFDARNIIAMPIELDKSSFPIDSAILCWDTPLAVAELSRQISSGKGSDAPFSGGGGVRTCIDRKKNETYQEPQKVWSVQSGWCIASVLCANAVVAAHGLPSASGKPPDISTYAVTAYDRNTGAQLWQAPLPEQPLMDGLSIARDGSVLVRLLNGRVLCFKKV